MWLLTGMFATALLFVLYRMNEHPRVRAIVRFWAIMGGVIWLVLYGIAYSISTLF